MINIKLRILLVCTLCAVQIHSGYSQLFNPGKTIDPIGPEISMYDPPTAYSATSISTSSFTARWSSVSGISSFLLDVSTSSNFSSFVSGYQSKVVSSTSHTISGLTPGRPYYYRLRSKDPSGTNSFYSNIVSLKTKLATPTQYGISTAGGLFRVNWGSVPGASYYQVDIARDANFTNFVYQGSQLGNINSTYKYVSSGLSPNTRYYVRIRAFSSYTSSPYSNSVNIYTLPVAPSSLSSGTINPSNISFYWSAVSGAQSYRYDISTSSNFSSFVSGKKNVSVSNPYVTVTGLVPGTRYYIRIRTIGPGGTSSNSSNASAITILNTPIVNSASNVQSNSFRISWNASANASYYHVAVSKNSSFTDILYQGSYLGNITATNLTISSSINSNTTYYYRVKAINSITSTSYGGYKSVRTLPKVPTIQNASHITTNSFRANWDASSGASSYRLDVSLSSSFTNFVSGYQNKTISGSYATVTGLSPGKRYYYRVRAYGNGGTTNNTVLRSATLNLVTPNVNAATNVQSNSFKISWSASANASYYHVAVSKNSSFTDILYQGSYLGNITATNLTISSEIQANTRYYYRVKALNSVTSTDYSAPKSALTAPAAVEIRDPSDINSTSFRANWISAAGAVNYSIDVSTNSSFNTFVSGYQNRVVSNTNTLITGLEGGTKYYYRVRAIGVDGSSSYLIPSQVVTDLASPLLKNVSNVSNNSFTINWWETEGADYYEVLVSRNASFTDILYVDELPNAITTTSHTLTNEIAPSTDYFYKVKAFNAITNSNFSDTGSLKTAPVKVQVIYIDPQLITDENFLISWDAVPEANNYLIDVSTSENFDTFLPNFEAKEVSNTNILVPNLESGTRYFCRLRAKGGQGASENSDIVNVITNLSTPILEAPYNETNNSFDIKWNSVDKATHYQVLISKNSVFSDLLIKEEVLSDIIDTEISINSLVQAHTKYFFKVRALNAETNSYYSNHKYVWTAPNYPQLNPANQIQESSFIASWNSVFGAKYYEIDVSLDLSFNSFLEGFESLRVDGNEVLIDQFTTDLTYYYRVRAISDYQSSANSPIKKLKYVTNLISSPNGKEVFVQGDFIPIQLDRSSISNERIYVEIYQNGVKVSHPQAYSSTGSTFEHYIPSGIEYGKNFKIRAFNEEFGIEDWSDEHFTIEKDQNYVRTYQAQVAGITDLDEIKTSEIERVITSTEFYDGLGRKTQTVLKQNSPDKNDLVMPVFYDGLGRISKEFLPVVLEDGSGWMKPDVLDETGNYSTEAASFYAQANGKIAQDTYLFSELEFEASPLNRVKATYSPGAAWAKNAGNKPIRQDYAFNSSDEVREFSLLANGEIDMNGYHEPNQLFKNIVTDEDGKQSATFTDSFGKTILKRNYLSETEYADTYYIYDIKDNLTTVLAPELINRLTATSGSLNAQLLLDLAFQYTYDGRNRMIKKKVPGADWVYMVYDDRDRLVLTQDGEQRLDEEWTFTKYDALNRVILTGIYTAPGEDIQSVSDQLKGSNWTNNFAAFESRGTAILGYSNNSFPTAVSVDKYLSVNYYDDYNFAEAQSNTLSFHEDEFNQSYNPHVKGLVTASFTKVLGSTAEWIKSITYYDDKYRVIQSVSLNHKNKIDRYSTRYDFNGTVLDSRVESMGLQIEESFTYDHAGRLKETYHEVASPIQWEGLIGYAKDEKGDLIHSGTAGYGNTNAYHAEAISLHQNAIYSVRIETSGRFLIGLNDDPNGTSYGNMDYSLYVSGNGQLYIYENGGRKTNSGLAFYQLGDRIKIVKEGLFIHYYHEDRLIYTSTKEVSTDLYADVTSYNVGDRIVDATIGIEGKVLMLSNEYNELGQLIKKELHQDEQVFAQSVDYRYNIRGWLERINKSDLRKDSSTEMPDLFGMQLIYTNTFGQDRIDRSQFNGNIAAVKWASKRNTLASTNSIEKSAYAYSYDPLNRIKTANFFEGKHYNQISKYGLNVEGYDMNGNIIHLKRNDDTGAQMDQLSYSYNGNQLLSVSDNSENDGGFIDGNTTDDDYDYDENGNMSQDLNKGITTIEYNLLNLPSTVFFENGDELRYIYDASGLKLRQEVYKAGALEKATDYVGAMIYENEELQFIQTSEGRIVPRQEANAGQMEYQYHLKDHLGNVRSTFAVRDDKYATSFELEQDPYFDNYASIEILEDPEKAKTDMHYNRVASFGAASQRVGITKTLLVSEGDKLQASVWAKYMDRPDLSETVNTVPLLGILGNMLAGGLIGGSEGEFVSGASASNFSAAALANNSNEEDPKAYFNYILMDKHFNIVQDGFAFKQLASSATADHQELSFENIEVQEDGYIIFYVSNESEVLSEVYFDDLVIEHHKTELIQADDYYPFGLTFNSYKKDYGKVNRYLYNDGAERIRDLDLCVDFTKYRVYDPAISRWWQIDPKSDGLVKWTPYNYSFNNPIRYNDPNGDCPPGVDCSSYWIGFAASVVDNTFGGLTGARKFASSYADDAKSFNTGQDHGDVTSVVIGAGMVDGGSATALGSSAILVGTGGTTAPVTGTTALVGAGVAAEGLVIGASGTNSLLTQKDRMEIQGSGQGRGKNKRQPDDNATGDHSVINERGSSTFEKNPKNPSGWQETSHIDTKGAAHTNKKTGQKVNVPHRQGKGLDGEKIPGGVEPVNPAPKYKGVN